MKGAGASRGVKRSGAFGQPPALGFEAFRTSEQLAAPVYLGSEEALKLPFRALLTKRDPTTRIKALADLEQAFRQVDADVCRDALPHWAFLYERCQKDNERRVRMGTNRVMAVLVQRFPKAMGEKKFEAFAPDWLCACFDPDANCASSARQSLDAAPVTSFAYKSVFSKLCKYIRQRSPDESFEELGGTPEEMYDRMTRVRAQALEALAFVVEKQKDMDGVVNEDLHSESNWYKYLIASDEEGGALVRRAAYRLLGTLAQTKYREDFAATQAISKAILRIPSEKDRGATPAMWEALLQVLQDGSFLAAQPMDGLRKGFFPEIFRHFDRRGNDGGFTVLNNVVVLLSLLPSSVWEAFGPTVFLKEWFGRLACDSNLSDEAVVQSSLECLLFVAKKRFDVIKDDPGALEFIRSEVIRLFDSFSRHYRGTGMQQVISIFAALAQTECIHFPLGENLAKFKNPVAALTFAQKLLASSSPDANGILVSRDVEHLLRQGIQSNVAESLLVAIFEKRNDIKVEEFIMLILEHANGVSIYAHFLAKLLIASTSSVRNQIIENIPNIVRIDDPGVQTALLNLLAELNDAVDLNTTSVSPLIALLKTNIVGDNPNYETLVLKYGNAEQRNQRARNISLRLHALFDDPGAFSSNAHEVRKELSSLVESCSDENVLKILDEKDDIYYTIGRFFVGYSDEIDAAKKKEVFAWAQRCHRFVDPKDANAFVELILKSAPENERLDVNADVFIMLLENMGDAAFSVVANEDGRSNEELLWSVLCKATSRDDARITFADDKVEGVNVRVSSRRTAILTLAIQKSVEEVSEDERLGAFRYLMRGWNVDDGEKLQLVRYALEHGADDVVRSLYVREIAYSIDVGGSAGDIFRHDLARFVSEAVDSITSFLKKEQDGSGGNQVSSEPPSQSVTPLPQRSLDFNVGDAVMYRRSNGQTFRATVVGRHDDDNEGLYYTVRYWFEERSNEVQTTPDRLDPVDAPNVPDMTEEERLKKLQEVHRLLQEARSSNNRAESVRLMKLQQSLLPKPKDTDEERAKIEAARQAAERLWREKRRLREERLRQGLSAEEDEDESVDYSAMRLVKLSEKAKDCLRNLGCLDWRLEVPFPFSESEEDAIRHMFTVFSDTQVLPEDSKDILNLGRALQLCDLSKNLVSSDFMYRLITRLNVLAPSSVLNRVLQIQAPIIPEAAAGSALSAWRNRSLQLDPSVLASLRYPASSVNHAMEYLMRMLTASESIEICAFIVVLLVRYPCIRIPSSNDDADSQSAEEEIAFARSLFPDSLLKTIEELTDINSPQLDNAFKLELCWLVFLRYVTIAWKLPNIGVKARKCIGAFLRHEGLVYRVLDLISMDMVLSNTEALPVLSVREQSIAEKVTAYVDDEIDTDSAFIRTVVLTKGDRDSPLQAKPRLASRSFFQTVHSLPALVREWWSDHLSSRLDKANVSRFMVSLVTPFVVKHDMDELSEAARSGAWDRQELTLRPSYSTRKVTICYIKDDCSLEMEVSFPDNYPLSVVTVECTKQIGIKQEKWKRWALQIVMLLTKRDGTLTDAVLLWKENLDKEFEGVEPCPICYSVLHAVDSSLPRLQCRTCKNVFHGKCLSQWFASSHQSLCPLCKQSFLTH